MTEKQTKEEAPATKLERAAINRWHKLYQRANKKNLDFDLTVQCIKKLLRRKKCFYSGVRMIKGDDTGVGLPNQRTFDRVDSSKGYTKANTVVCIHRINQLKDNGTIDDFHQIYLGMLDKIKESK